MRITCTCAERSAAADHASSGVPAYSPASPLPSTTMQNARRSTGSSAAARSSTCRTGVHLLPMMRGLVMTAPSQWKKCRISGPEMPGKMYLLPPEKPTTSCGNTGPTMTTTS